MNCRSFKHQITDWKSDRLSPERSRLMADHARVCAACAEEADAEDRMRASWHGLVGNSPDTDLWPRIAARLEATTRPPIPATRCRQWALAGVFCLAAMAMFGLSLGPRESPSAEQSTDASVSAQWSSHVPVPTSSERIAVVSGLSDVSHVDPAVDDPAGKSMENVWLLIHTSHAPSEERR